MARAVGAWAGPVEIPGGPLYTEVVGEGPPVVLLHGGMLDLRQWDEQMDALTRAFTVIRYDARGYGRSPLGSEPYAHHADLAALLRALDIDRPHLVALSNGGTIALDLAVERPELVASLCIGAAPMPGYDLGADFTEGIRGILRAGAAGDRATCRRLLWAFAPLRVAGSVPRVRERVDRMIVEEFSFANARPDAPKRLRAEPPAAGRLRDVRAPTLVIVGGGEMAALFAQAQWLAREIPGASLRVIEGAGHIVNMERPAEYTRVVLDWLRERAAAPGTPPSPIHDQRAT